MKIHRMVYIVLIAGLVLFSGLRDLKAEVVRTFIPGTKIEVIAEVDARGKIIYIIDFIDDGDEEPDGF